MKRAPDLDPPVRSIDRSLARFVHGHRLLPAPKQSDSWTRGVDDATRSAKWNKFQPFDRFFYFLTVLSLSRFESDYNKSWKKEMRPPLLISIFRKERLFSGSRLKRGREGGGERIGRRATILDTRRMRRGAIRRACEAWRGVSFAPIRIHGRYVFLFSFLSALNGGKTRPDISRHCGREPRRRHAT